MITTDQVARKFSQERLLAYNEQNIDAVQSCKILIFFFCDTKIPSCAFQALYHGWLYLQDKGTDVQTSVTDILLNGQIDLLE